MTTNEPGRSTPAALAGLLAELAERELDLIDGAQVRRLQARVTDLPGIIRAAGDGATLHAPTIGATFRIGGGRVELIAGDDAVRVAFDRISREA